MADEPKKSAEPGRTWWLTLPGLLTATATLLTALTGLLLGLQKLGWIGGDEAGPARQSPAAASSPLTGPSARSPAGLPTVSPRSSDASSPGNSGTEYSVEVDLGQSYRSGNVAYKVTAVGAEADTDATLRLTFHVKASNTGRFDINFWDDSFRLDVGADRYAPVSGLDEIVAADSTGTGDVVFVVPSQTTAASLVLKFAQGEKTVPFTISPS